MVSTAGHQFEIVDHFFYLEALIWADQKDHQDNQLRQYPEYSVFKSDDQLLLLVNTRCSIFTAQGDLTLYWTHDCYHKKDPDALLYFFEGTATAP